VPKKEKRCTVWVGDDNANVVELKMVCLA
jgi:hypothetical protein